MAASCEAQQACRLSAQRTMTLPPYRKDRGLRRRPSRLERAAPRVSRIFSFCGVRSRIQQKFLQAEGACCVWWGKGGGRGTGGCNMGDLPWKLSPARYPRTAGMRRYGSSCCCTPRPVAPTAAQKTVKVYGVGVSTIRACSARTGPRARARTHHKLEGEDGLVL
eukprot:1827733-Prymnesium_polylepis.2